MSNGKSLIDSLADWVSGLGVGLRTLFASPRADDKASLAQTTDPDFDGWLVNDSMVTFDPASRYGDDATGLLAGGERDNPELAKNDD